jgi:CRISPR-associated protein Cas5h
MRCIVFEVRGEYAHFKKPYSPMSPVTYPFPPPTAVMGLLGAIIGYGKEEYHDRLGWQSLRVGISLQEPIKIMRSAINLLNTKDGHTDAFFRPKADKNTHIQIPFEFIKSAAYRIYITDLNEAASQALVEHLTQGRTTYTPVLGLASCLADITWIGEWPMQPILEPEWTTTSVVPLDKTIKIHYDDNRRYHRLRVPVVMDSQRIVHRYQEAVVAENAQPIRGQGGDHLFFRVNHETIAFFPNLSTSPK